MVIQPKKKRIVWHGFLCHGLYEDPWDVLQRQLKKFPRFLGFVMDILRKEI